MAEDGETEEKPEGGTRKPGRPMNRRRFIKVAVAGGGAALAGLALGGPSVDLIRPLIEGDGSVPKSPTQQRAWVMVIDLSRCHDCGYECTAACQEHHFAAPEHEYIKVYAREDKWGEGKTFPRPCMHCDEPPCRDVCPVSATFKRDDGLVLIDHDKCIGCRYCMAACPYAARYFNWGEPEHTPEELAHEYSVEEPWPHRKGVVDKCDFCPDTAYLGNLPPCVQSCPNKAIFFGDASEDAVSNGSEVLHLSQTLEERGAFRLKEELGTEPRVYYLADVG